MSKKWGANWKNSFFQCLGHFLPSIFLKCNICKFFSGGRRPINGHLPLKISFKQIPKMSVRGQTSIFPPRIAFLSWCGGGTIQSFRYFVKQEERWIHLMKTSSFSLILSLNKQQGHPCVVVDLPSIHHSWREVGERHWADFLQFQGQGILVAAPAFCQQGGGILFP